MSLAHIAAIISSVLAGLANPPSPHVPRVLLDAPIAMRIAANDIEHWRALGVSGFLLHGVYDSLDASPQGGLQDFGDTAPESSLLKEIRLSVSELSEAGLENNFLRVNLGPDRPWFADREAARDGVRFLEGAGIFCARAGLRGLALDLRTSSPMYEYNWRGHGQPRSSTQLSALAREFGRRGLRAFIRAMPDADFIFIVDDLGSAGPLIYPLLEGLIESVGAAEAIRLDIMLPIPTASADFPEQSHYLEDMEEQVCGGMGEDARKIWQRQGGYAPVLSPLVIENDAVTSKLPLADFRIQLAIAKLVASDYIAVRGDYGTWWKLSAKQANAYRKLRQQGAARATVTPKALAGASSWGFQSPFDAMQRVGVLRERKDTPYVFQDGLQSAVLFWKAPPGPIALDQGVAGGLLDSVGTGGALSIAPTRDGVQLDAATMPGLLHGLPINDWAAPAALWCAFDATPSAGVDRVPVRLGLRNVYPGDLSAILKVETPDTLSLGTGSLPLFLKPGDTVVFEKALQGTFALGETESLRIALESPLSSGVARRFSTRAHLRQQWRQRRDGALATAPLVLQEATGPVIVAVSDAGDAAGYGADGTLIWQRRFPTPVVLGDWAGRGDAEEPLLAIGDAEGGVRVMRARGGAVWEATLPSAIEEVLFADVFAVGRDALLVVTRDNALTCFNANGRVEWRYAPGDKLYIGSPSRVRRFFPEARAAEERLFVSVGGGLPRLARLDGHGAVLWERGLPGAPGLPPVMLADDAGQAARVIAPLLDGKSSLFSMDIGAPLEATLPELKGTWNYLVPLDQGRDSASEVLLAAVGTNLMALDSALKPLWQADIGRVRGLSRAGGDWLALVGSKIIALDAVGSPRWNDTPPLGIRALAPLGLARMGNAPQAFVAGGSDGFLYTLEFPPIR